MPPGEAVHAVGDVHGVAHAGDHEDGEHDEGEHREVDHVGIQGDAPGGS
jgi:hypothetical protein